MKQPELLITAEEVESSPIDFSTWAEGILDHLESLKQDPEFMAGFEEWKRQRKEVKTA